MSRAGTVRYASIMTTVDGRSKVCPSGLFVSRFSLAVSRFQISREPVLLGILSAHRFPFSSQCRVFAGLRVSTDLRRGVIWCELRLPVEMGDREDLARLVAAAASYKRKHKEGLARTCVTTAYELNRPFSLDDAAALRDMRGDLAGLTSAVFATVKCCPTANSSKEHRASLHRVPVRLLYHTFGYCAVMVWLAVAAVPL